MESLVFRDSPLAEYLEGEGEHEADWGIEPSGNLTDSTNTSEREQPISFAPSSTLAPKVRLRKSLKPLQINDPQWYRKAKFNDVLSGGLKSRLAAGENLQFVERFRYVLVASQLLNDQASVANYDHIRDTPTPIRAAVSKASSPLVTWFGNPSPRFYTSLAASIVILAILLAWIGRPDRKASFGKSRTAIALLMSMVMMLIVFAQLRRKKLRNLRSETLSAAERFVENCQLFDIVTGNALTLIQEIELVSRGYRLSQPLPPITRLERKDNTRRCARLRRTILASFQLSISPQTKSIEMLAVFPKISDLEKFYDIYEIRASDLRELSLGFSENEFDDIESLKALKTLFQRLYIIRKVFICHLLALEAHGGKTDHIQWRKVTTQLDLLSSLMSDLAYEIKSILDEEQDFAVPPTPKAPLTPNRERLRGQLRRLNSLSTSVRGLQAKMHLLREGTDKALNANTTADEINSFGPELLLQYDGIGADLHALLGEWESGRTALSQALERSIDSPTVGPTLMSPTATLIGSSPRTSGSWDELMSPINFNEKRKRVSTGSNLSVDITPSSDENDEKEVVYEAVSEPRGGRERSKLSREERVTRMKEDRAKAADARKQMEASVSLVKELQNVLEARPIRKSMHAGNRKAYSMGEQGLEKVMEGIPLREQENTATPMRDSAAEEIQQE